MQIGQALLCVLGYMIACFIDDLFGWQTCTRPIVLGPIVGLVCGDVVTGALMGAQLEAVYMGVSAIGGVISSNYRVATAVGVGLVIMNGVDMETGVTLAAAIGAVVNSLQAIQKAIRAAIHPFMIKTLRKGNYKGMVVEMWITQILVSDGFNAIIIFLCLALGSTVVQGAVAACPSWVLTGLNASGNMLVVIGLALTTQAIWMKNAILYVLLGFILYKYVGLAILPIAAIGIIFALLTYSRDIDLKNMKEEAAATPAAAAATEGGDDFYA